MKKDPIFIKKYLNNLENENVIKLDEMNNELKITEDKKKEFDDQNKNLKDLSETYCKKVNIFLFHIIILH
jgi:hypothetical protein